MDHARALREALSNGDSGERRWQWHLCWCVAFFGFEGESCRDILLVVFGWKVFYRARDLNWGGGCNVSQEKILNFNMVEVISFHLKVSRFLLFIRSSVIIRKSEYIPY